MLTITKGRSAELQTCRAPVDSQAATHAVDEFVKKSLFSPSLHPLCMLRPSKLITYEGHWIQRPPLPTSHPLKFIGYNGKVLINSQHLASGEEEMSQLKK
jgi:hypothetical protein